MNTKQLNTIPECRRQRWPFQRHATAWLPTLTLCLLGYLAPATADPNPNPNYPKDANVSVGASVTFQVSATSTNPPLTYQWQHAGTDLPGATNATLVIANITVADAGGYTAWITNASGGFTNTRTATLTVDPTFTKIMTGVIVTDAEGSEGGNWADYDNDGYVDLFVANSASSGSSTRNTLYHNNGGTNFSRVAASPFTNDLMRVWMAAWADYDNDGKVDLIAGNLDGGTLAQRLYRNNGNGNFTAVVDSALRSDTQSATCPWWMDYDNDGFLDLFMAKGMYDYGVANDCLFRNNGDGTFKKMTAAQVGPMLNDQMQTFLSFSADYDNDGRQELSFGYMVSANYVSSTWRYATDGTFVKSTPIGIANRFAQRWWGDYDNDGWLDAFCTDWDGGTALFHNQGAGGFTNATAALNLAPPLSYFAAWGDYDNDGWLDLFFTGPYWASATKNGMFHNNRDGTFTQILSGSPVYDLGRRITPSWIDYDNDGFLDLFIAAGDTVAEKNLLYRNNGNTNHWLKVKLDGRASNRSGIGARVRAQATINGQLISQMREISCENALVGQNGLLAHFGLGDATNVTTLRIEWPSGNVQELANVTPNRIITVTEPTLITPAMPSASLNGSATLTRSFVSGATYQWRFDGVDLVGQTSRILNLTNISVGQEGRYSVVVSNVSTLVTNFVYLHVDTQFTKITQGPIVNDRLDTWFGRWGDYDNDGRLDVLVNGYSGHWRLYHNDGGTMFSTVTNGVMGEYNRRDMWGIWADPDNDDDLDMFAAVSIAVSPINMFWNDGGGNFTRVPTHGVPEWGAVSAWGDYDQDGFIDAFCGSYEQGVNALLHNNGDGTFSRVTNSILNFSTDLIQVTCAVDYDNDGDLDLIPVRWGGQPTRFYRNDGRGTFTEATPQPIRSELTYSLSAAWGDFDNDGDLDVIFGGYNGTRERFYINNGDGSFTRWAGQPALFESYDTLVGSLLAWGDFDNDGYLDLVASKGDKPIRLWRNRGDGSFAQVLMGSLVNETGSFIQSGCWVDFNQDGNLDFFVATLNSGVDKLFMGNGNGNRWLEVKPKGTKSNRQAIGAKIFATATVRGKVMRQMRVITASDSDESLIAHFGLGDATKVTALRIEWPSGAVQEIPNVTANQVLTVYEPPALAAAVRADGACELTIKAEPNRVWQIQASSDLLTWQMLTTVTNASYQFQFTDPAVPGMICRFYRLQSQ